MNNTYQRISIFFLTVLCFANVSTVKAQAKINKMVASVKEVTVFRQGAQILAAASGNIPAGVSNIQIDNLPLSWKAGSLQAGSNKDNLLILSIKENIVEEVPEEEPETIDKAEQERLTQKILILQDSIDRYRFEIAKLNKYDEALRYEETLLFENKSVTHAPTVTKSSEVQKMADLFRERLQYIYSNQLQNQRKRELWQKKIQKTEDKIALVRNGTPKKAIVVKPAKTRSIELSVKAESATEVTLFMRMQIENAGWTPTYDFLGTGESTAKLNLRASVWQQSGQKWNNVRLKVSSGQPQADGNKPQLRTLYVGFVQRSRPSKRLSMSGAMPSTPSVQRKMAEEMKESDASMESADEALSNRQEVFDNTEENDFFAEYTASVPYTILSGAEAQWVDLTSFSLKTTYDYALVPKMSNEGFLMANIMGWEDLNLVSAPMNVYYKGTLVGNSILNVNDLTSDTLAVSLGRTNKLTVKRQVMKNFTSRQLIGTQRKLAQGFVITLRNNNKETTEVLLEDHIPISQDSRISVKIEDLEGGRLDPDTGIIRWRVKLKANESKKIKLRYVVEYPKDLEVQMY